MIQLKCNKPALHIIVLENKVNTMRLRENSMRYKFLVFYFSIFICTIKVHAQYSMGTTGQLNIPTAEMQETGTFMIGGNYLPKGMTPFKFNTGNYFVNITLFSFLELDYRCTLLKTKRKDGQKGYFQQDRSMSARIQPLKEGKYIPAIVIGTNDPFADKGTNYFASIYGVVTKNFSLFSGDKLGISAGYYFPLNKQTCQDGPFGGISYSPAFYPKLTFMAEYDSKGFNIGAAAKLWKHFSLHVFTREFNCISGGIRYECTLIH